MAAPRWRRRKDERPAEILEAALESFARHGFAATRLDDVAARAGVSKGTLYLYFPSKAELFKGVVRQELLPNLERGEAMVDAHEGPTADLVRNLVLLLGTAVAGTRLGAIPKLVIAESGNFPELGRFYLKEVIERGLRLIGAILQRGVDRGEFRDVDIGHAARSVVAPFLVLAVWRTVLEPVGAQPVDVERYCQDQADILLRGLMADRDDGDDLAR